ncbi:MAG: putative metal-binding motif-containing protein [Deltaproteobacteria bacterium]|nr:putative metal-binding motif-containing protein [Deltaproteobacteria bacterium]
MGGPTSYLLDVDQDGFGDDATLAEGCAPAEAVTVGGDCDDAQATVYPGAAEACDGLDNDCDGLLDGDDDDNTGAVDWYRDEDADGYGVTSDSVRSCDGPRATPAGGDCDDANATTSPAPPRSVTAPTTTVTASPMTTTTASPIRPPGASTTTATATARPLHRDTACAAPEGYVSNAEDCDDAEATALPAGLRSVDRLDNNCDGAVDEATAADAQTWYQDADLDGFGDPDFTTLACEAPSGYAENDEDCDDDDFGVNPDAEEVCDSVDNDCDGSTDGADASDTARVHRRR